MAFILPLEYSESIKSTRRMVVLVWRWWWLKLAPVLVVLQVVVVTAVESYQMVKHGTLAQRTQVRKCNGQNVKVSLVGTACCVPAGVRPPYHFKAASFPFKRPTIRECGSSRELRLFFSTSTTAPSTPQIIRHLVTIISHPPSKWASTRIKMKQKCCGLWESTNHA